MTPSVAINYIAAHLCARLLVVSGGGGRAGGRRGRGGGGGAGGGGRGGGAGGACNVSIRFFTTVEKRLFIEKVALINSKRTNINGTYK